MTEGAALDFDCVEKVRPRRDTFGWTIKTAPPKRTQQPRIAFNAPIAIPSTAIEIKSYEDLIRVLRARCDELSISRETVDHISGLQPGYSGKVLSIKKVRKLGAQSFGLLLQALCLKLVAVPREPKKSENSKLISAFRKRARELKTEDQPIDICTDEVKRIGLNALESMLDVLCLTLMALRVLKSVTRRIGGQPPRAIPKSRSKASWR
jgi:hypothetical protein